MANVACGNEHFWLGWAEPCLVLEGFVSKGFDNMFGSGEQDRTIMSLAVNGEPTLLLTNAYQ